jgi:hypothetical protein
VFSWRAAGYHRYPTPNPETRLSCGIEAANIKEMPTSCAVCEVFDFWEPCFRSRLQLDADSGGTLEDAEVDPDFNVSDKDFCW